MLRTKDGWIVPAPVAETYRYYQTAYGQEQADRYLRVALSTHNQPVKARAQIGKKKKFSGTP
ncbi:MAG: hypothetical protein VKL39_20515 [Leptolyngbyaceae bacterium]|nr:hypothetical protein [Leptolyngbyaceae bacterium]